MAHYVITFGRVVLSIIVTQTVIIMTISATKANSRRSRTAFVSGLAILILAILPTSASAYSVLTHEAIVDTLWVDSMLPVLTKRFPDATDAQLTEAHAYAYGGCIIQDLGYYPFGSHLFSDLAHLLGIGGKFLLLEEEFLAQEPVAVAAGFPFGEVLG